MIAAQVVIIDQRLPGRHAARHQIAPGAEGQRRHAQTRKGEMVGPEIPAGLRIGFGHHHQAHGLRRIAEIAFQRGAAAADQFQAAGARQLHVRIEIDHGHRAGQRHQRIGSIMFGTEQALLLRRPRCKHQRARRARAGGKGAGNLDQFGGAGGIVDGAVADGVALRIGHTLPVGVPVRAEQHGLAGLRRAGQLAHDVVTGERRRGQPAARGGGSGQRQGAEIGFASGGLGAGQIQARGGQQPLAQPAFDPAGKAESAAKCRRARHHLRHAFGADQLRQRIGGGEILMQHDGAHGAGLGGGCHLDADAASISKAAALKAQIGPGFTIRIAGEQQHHLAGHIHPRIGIMPARHHAEAGKDHRRGADRHVAGQAQR